MLLMGLDVGTTGVKAAVFDHSGYMHGYAFAEYGVNCPAPGYAEQDAEAVFAAMKQVMREAASQSGPAITAIGISVQGDAVIALDKDFNALIPMHLGMDYRCKSQAAAFAAEFGEKNLFERTGMRPHPMNSLCKIRWITEELPEVAQKACYYMTYADLILTKLGGERVIDYTMATRTMGMNIHTLQWDSELLHAAGIHENQLSKPVPSGTKAGVLSPELSRELGIDANAILVPGGHDQTCAAFGAGVVEPDIALDSHGTAEVVSTAFRAPRLGAKMYEGHFPCYRHSVPEMYFTFSLNHTGGILLKWFCEGFCAEDMQWAQQTGESVYARVLEMAGDKPSSLLALPYFSGRGTPSCDLDAKGMLIGLTMSSTRYDVARALLEALCFDLRENVEALGSAGVKIAELRCVGGGAKSPLSLQLKADITGLPIRTLAIREAACLGAALLGGMAIGAYSDVHEAASVVRLGKEYLPRDDTRAFYDSRYAIYRKLYLANCDIMKKM